MLPCDSGSVNEFWVGRINSANALNIRVSHHSNMEIHANTETRACSVSLVDN